MFLLFKDSLLSQFINRENFLEVRIGAFEQLVRCPSASFLHSIRNLLEEGSDGNSPQIRTYVYTKIHNFLHSSDQNIEEKWENMLSQHGIDMFKYEIEFTRILASTIRISRNTERNFYLPGPDIGAQIGGNWIWLDQNTRQDQDKNENS